MARLLWSPGPVLCATPGDITTYPSPLGTRPRPDTASAEGGVSTVSGAGAGEAARRGRMSTGEVRELGLARASPRGSEDSEWTRVTVEVDLRGVEVTWAGRRMVSCCWARC